MLLLCHIFFLSSFSYILFLVLLSCPLPSMTFPLAGSVVVIVFDAATVTSPWRARPIFVCGIE